MRLVYIFSIAFISAVSTETLATSNSTRLVPYTINIQGGPFVIITPAGKLKFAPKTGNIRVINPFNGKNGEYEIFLENINGDIVGVEIYNSTAKHIKFTPLNSARSLLISKVWDYTAQGSLEEKKIINIIDSEQFKGNLQKIVKSFGKDGTISTEKSNDLAFKLVGELVKNVLKN